MEIFSDIYLLLILLSVGCFAGFMAGILGIGGGIIIVPIVLYTLQHQFGNIPHIQHIAVGTSFAVMISTSLSSVLAHHKYHSIRWDIFKNMTPGIIIATIIGSFIAASIPAKILQLFFIIFIIIIAIQTLLDAKPKPSRTLPLQPEISLIGGFIGLISSWIGIGGGSLSIPFLTYCNISIRHAVGTSAAIGWPIAITGTFTYLISGLKVTNLPPGTLGFIYIPSTIILAICTVIFAPLGAKISNLIAPRKLKIFFALFLIVLAIKMCWQLLS